MMPERIEADAAQIKSNYQDATNLMSRFEMYQQPFATADMDVEKEVIEKLCLGDDRTIVNIGSSNGHFERRLREEASHSGVITGVEPNIGQLLNDESMMSWLADSEKSTKTYFLQGYAHRLPLADNTADCLTAMFMFYHVPIAQQSEAFAEFKRVLKPGGMFVLATSQATNKANHRELESIIANKLGIQPPVYMNASFNSETAAIILPTEFSFVYAAFTKSAWIKLDDKKKVDRYMDSLRSLRDQYRPPIIEITTAVIKAEADARAAILKVMRKHKMFTDPIHRDYFICSDSPQPELEKDGVFTEISSHILNPDLPGIERLWNAILDLDEQEG